MGRSGNQVLFEGGERRGAGQVGQGRAEQRAEIERDWEGVTVVKEETPGSWCEERGGKGRGDGRM